MKRHLSALALASLFVACNTSAQFATAVVAYVPGADFSPGFTNAVAALGEPSRATPGAFGGPVDPFDPPYLATQLVSIGAGGSLTVEFGAPVLDDPKNRFGIDFIIFGNTGFVITNDFSFETFDWIGTPATDGSLLGQNPGETRVSVSLDGVTFYQLNPAFAPAVDGPLPTDGAGDFHTPADPTLTPADFAGLTAAQIRALYFGSAGGTGYDISWARTAEGEPVRLPAINYVRVTVVSGKSDVGGFASVFVPPCHAAVAETFTEDFSGDPATNGWRVFGDTNLFQWDPENRNLRVTWDSSRTNSFFHRPLGTILTRDDDFQLGFDLTFSDYASGVTPNKPNSTPAVIGWLNLDQATQTNFLRGTGINATYGPKNLVEFEFFPAFSTFLPTIAQVVVSTNNQWLYNHENLQELTPGETFRVLMTYAADTHTLTTIVSDRAGQYGPTQTISVPTNRDFRVATVAVSSYSDKNSLDSLLAHGIVDNFTVTVPPPPVQNLSAMFRRGVWEVQFGPRSHWHYTLQRTADFATWTDVSTATATTETNLVLSDTNPPPGKASYRVQAQRP